MPPIDEMTLPNAAHALRISWHAAYDLVLSGRLEGHNVNGRWKVTAESVREESVRRGLVNAQPASTAA